MATHSRILAWRIPRIEEPGGYSPWGHKESDATEVARHALFLMLSNVLLFFSHSVMSNYFTTSCLKLHQMYFTNT